MMKTEQLQQKGTRNTSSKDAYIKLYLTLYNLFQFCGYTYIVAVMLSRFAKLGNESLPTMYEHVGPIMVLLQSLAVMEVIHPIVGFTRGDAILPFMQVVGRNIVLFMNIFVEPRIQKHSVIFYLFLVWSLIETVRYPFYITQIYKKDIFIIKWLRYNLWIPLYPCGFVCESLVVIGNIPYFEESKRLTVSLPNDWNFAFHMPTFSKIHLVVVVAGGLFLMKSMFATRKSKLKENKKSN